MRDKIMNYKLFLIKLSNLSLLVFLCSCNYVAEFEEKARRVNNYQKTALVLAKENRELRFKNNQLKTKIKTLEAEKNFLEIKLEKKGYKRTLASIKPKVKIKNDYVKQSVYNWPPSTLLAIAEDNFKKKKYIQSAQFFYTLLVEYPKYHVIDDRVLFQAGVASYESRKYFKWSLKHLMKLTRKYPESSYYRGAKLWIALSHLKLGEQDKFYKIVEEFRLKYRNTQEWKIISSHYEEFTKKYKKRL
jgi:hypothetical protein